MTDIPDEIVERVAIAIAKELYVDGNLSDDREGGSEWVLARAALKESGWAEMREELVRLRSELEQAQQAAFNAEETRQALDGLYGACTRYDDEPDSPLVQARYGAARDFARSVLFPPPPREDGK